MGKYGPNIGNDVGSAEYPKTAIGPHNFQRSYYRSAQTSGVGIRAHYEDLEFTGTIGGEVIRARGIANGLLCATGSTINAAHFTGRVEAAKTVSGGLNAVRATLEIAGSTPSPGGTLSALQLDSNIVTGSLHPLNSSAFIRVTQTGVGLLDTLMLLPATEADGHNADVLSTAGVDKAATHYVRIVLGTTPAWIMVTTTAPAHS